MARASERDRYKYGICTNRDKGGEGAPCPKCESKEVQKVRGGQDFVCDECKEPLRMVPPPKEGPNMKMIGGIIAAVVVLGGAGIGIALSGGDKTEEQQVDDTTGGIEQVDGATDDDGMEVEEVNVTDMTFMETAQDMKLKKSETKQLNIDCNPGNANETVTWKSGNEAVATVSPNGIVTAVAAGKATITAVADRSQTKAEIEVTVSDGGSTGTTTVTDGSATSGIVTKDLGYAVYKGRMKNGLMNDESGVLTFKTTHIIEPRDVKKREAKAGEKVVGIFEDGHLTTGTWYKSDGNKEVIIP
ncbi:Ig-like domain-containing protein [Bacteroides sp. GM023]|uniref:Ig-like domain-containing protein n=1 Tax=Bacteroides sp. GM023 TaxID=2723058 RepID=UPI00168A41EC|nr:Ig-like domain-containing protein [Bacteroides sp. GM023]